MSCRRHPFQLAAGVCASCLRERLYDLIASQNKLPCPTNSTDLNPLFQISHHLPIPGSVSPSFPHRRSIGSDGQAINRGFTQFFSTPTAGDFSRRKGHSFWSSVFRHSRSESVKPRSSISWFSALIRRKKSGNSIDLIGSDSRLESGMAPAIGRRIYGGEDSGNSSDSDGAVRLPGPTPIRHVSSRVNQSGVGRSISGFAVCLSPLVRTNPSCRRRRPSESSLPVNEQIRRHVSFGEPGSFGLQSRKMAYFDRFK